MKLRIRGNSIRLRLTKSEVAALAETGTVEESTQFAGGSPFRYAVSASQSADVVSAMFVDGRLEVVVPRDVAVNWSANETVGIDGESGATRILIEKDFNCLTPRDAEEDADTFPHPKTDGIC